MVTLERHPLTGRQVHDSGVSFGQKAGNIGFIWDQSGAFEAYYQYILEIRASKVPDRPIWCQSDLLLAQILHTWYRARDLMDIQTLFINDFIAVLFCFCLIHASFLLTLLGGCQITTTLWFRFDENLTIFFYYTNPKNVWILEMNSVIFLPAYTINIL